MLWLVLQACLVMVIWGSVPSVIKIIPTNPIVIGIVRLVIAGVILLFFSRAHAELRNLGQRDWFYFVALGVCFGIHWLTYFYSIRISTPSIAAIGLSSYGVHLVLLSRFYYGSRIGLMQLISIGLAITGSLCLVPKFDLNNQIAQGLILGFLSSFAFALLPILHKASQHVSSRTRTLAQFAFALPVFLPFLDRANVEIAASDWLWLIYLAVVATALAHFMWVRVSTELSTSLTGVLYYLWVPAAMTFSALLTGEIVNTRLILGGGLVIAGSILGVKHSRVS